MYRFTVSTTITVFSVEISFRNPIFTTNWGAVYYN